MTMNNKDTTQQEVSWINGKPIAKGEIGDAPLVAIMIGFAVFTAFLFVLFGGDRHDS